MRRGEVWWVDFEPAQGSEATKVRPAVVISNDGANTACAMLGRGVVTVVPLTSATAKVQPFQVWVPAGEAGLDNDSKAQAEQVRALDVRRLASRVGALSLTRLNELDDALRLHLNL